MRGRRACVTSFAVLWCPITCLVQFVPVWCLSALQGLIKGECKALLSDWGWSSLFSRLTCNSKPQRFTMIVYPTLPSRVYPHNLIIPDKIFYYVENFQCRPDQSSFGPFFFFPLQQQSVQVSFWQQKSLCKAKYCIGLVFPIGPNGRSFSEIIAIVVSEVWLQWRLWPSSLYSSDIKRSQGKVEQQNVAVEGLWLIYCNSLSKMSNSVSRFFKMRSWSANIG